jgi:hypothetical protein
LPLSAVLPFDAVIDKSEVLALSRRLLAADNTEAHWAAEQIYLSARKIWPNDFKKPLATNSNASAINNLALRLGLERLSDTSNEGAVRLLDASPRQEFDLVAESLYPYSNLSLVEITEDVSDWPYQQKYEALRQLADQPSLLRNVSYKMDVISDQIELLKLAQAAHLRRLQVQALTPRYGFDVPQLFEDALLDDLFNDCFDQSLELYSRIQAAGHSDTLPYATLLGHKVRWQLDSTAYNLWEASKAGSKDSLLKEALERAREVHPLLWDVLTTSGSGSSPKLQSHNRVKSYHQRRKSNRGNKPKKP